MKVAWFFLLAWCPVLAWAQYTGGEGGSYASTALVLNPQLPFAIEVRPNPVQAGTPLHVRATDVRTKLEWKIWGIDGRFLAGQSLWPEDSIIDWEIPAPQTSGIYMLEIAVDGRTLRQKILVLAP